MSLGATKHHQALLAGFVIALGWLPGGAVGVAETLAARQPLIHVWRAEDGLPQNSITCLAQTPDGYLWVGTRRGGLARFDGIRFVKFTPQTTPELPDVEIEHLTVDATGAMWISTGIESITVYRGGRFHLVREPRAPPRWHPTAPVATYSNAVLFAALAPELRRLRTDTLSTEAELLSPVPPLGDRPWSYCQDRDGALWYRTAEKGLGRYGDGSFAEVFTPSAWNDRRVQALLRGADGRVWIASSRRLAVWQEGEFQDRTPADGPVPEDIQAVVAAGDGSFWVCERQRLRRLQQGRWVAEAEGWELGDNGAGVEPRFSGDSQGGLWVIDYGVGVRHVRSDGAILRLTEQEGLPSRFISCVLEDREGNIWLGSVGGGLTRIRERVFEVFGVEAGLPSETVQSVCEDAAGTVWVGLASGELLRKESTGFRAVPLPQPTQRRLESVTVFPASGNGLWIGSLQGGIKQWRDEQILHPFPPERLLNASARVLFQDSRERLWIGSGVGLYVWRTNRLTLLGKRHGFVDNIGIGAFAEQPAGVVWIGTGAGDLWRYQDDQFTCFSPPKDQPRTRIAALLPQANGPIWIGTLGGGLLRFEADRFQRLTTHEGLPDDTITQLLSDAEGDLWAGSYAGILHLRKHQLERVFSGQDKKLECRTFGQFDGLPTLECSGGFQPASWRARDGRLWFATVKGAVAVRPEAVTVNRLPPPVLIEEMRVDGKARDFPSGNESHRTKRNARSPVLEIEPGRHYVQFRFTGLSFTAPDKVRFQWKLEGVESGWQEGGAQREAGYGPLPPGDYRFVVRACNNDGIWNEAGAALAFKVLPHFWETWWFKATVLAALFMALVLVLISTLRHRHRLELERLERRHAVESERVRIAQDLHDDLGTGLTQISMLSALAEREQVANTETQAWTRQIRARSRQLVSALNEIVWAVNPKNDSLNELIGYFGNFAEEFFRGSGIRCRLDFPDHLPDSPLVSETRHNLFLAFKEAVNNAAKHARATEVRVRAQLAGGQVTLTVEDNGCGFERGRQGNGLANMRQRLHKAGGDCEMSSRPGQGTRVEFRFPAA